MWGSFRVGFALAGLLSCALLLYSSSPPRASSSSLRSLGSRRARALANEALLTEASWQSDAGDEKVLFSVACSPFSDPAGSSCVAQMTNSSTALLGPAEHIPFPGMHIAAVRSFSVDSRFVVAVVSHSGRIDLDLFAGPRDTAPNARIGHVRGELSADLLPQAELVLVPVQGSSAAAPVHAITLVSAGHQGAPLTLCPVGYLYDQSRAACTPCGEGMTTVAAGAHACTPTAVVAQARETALRLGCDALRGRLVVTLSVYHHATRTAHMLRLMLERTCPSTVFVVHINSANLGGYGVPNPHDVSEAWRSLLHEESNHARRLIINPQSILVEWGRGSVLYSNLLNVIAAQNWLGASLQHVLFVQNNDMLYRPGVEQYIEEQNMGVGAVWGFRPTEGWGQRFAEAFGQLEVVRRAMACPGSEPPKLNWNAIHGSFIEGTFLSIEAMNYFLDRLGPSIHELPRVPFVAEEMFIQTQMVCAGDRFRSPAYPVSDGWEVDTALHLVETSQRRQGIFDLDPKIRQDLYAVKLHVEVDSRGDNPWDALFRRIMEIHPVVSVPGTLATSSRASTSAPSA